MPRQRISSSLTSKSGRKSRSGRDEKSRLSPAKKSRGVSAKKPRASTTSAGRTTKKAPASKKKISKPVVKNLRKAVGRVQFHVDRYVGVSLSGGKNEKTGIAVLEHYREQKKLFLHSVSETTQLEGAPGKRSLDSYLHDFLKDLSPGLRKVGWDVPLSLPVCFSCKLECPGFENCGEPNIEWMWKAFERQKRKRAQARVFTPYTQRAVEFWLQEQKEETLPMDSALGSNGAPLLARAHFLNRRLGFPSSEVFVPLSLMRIGNQLGIGKSFLKTYKHSIHGHHSRSEIVRTLVEAGIVFMYQADLTRIQEHPQAFEAFISGLVVYLEAMGQTEPRPKDFPKGEGWIAVPKADHDWSL